VTAHLADLRYVPPPTAPVLTLHPSRMSASRLAATGLAATRPDAVARDLSARLRDWSGRAACVLTESGRAALRLALVGSGAAPGGEVVLSTFTCPAVADAVLASGATPVFVDVDPVAGPAYGSVPLEGRIVVLTNGLGHDEWAAHARTITERGGRVVLDLARAVPSPVVLRRYATTGCPIVLSFGEGKALGGLGGGALLTDTDAPEAGAPAKDGVPALRRAVREWVLQRAPKAGRAADVRRQRRAPGWSTTRADHLADRPGPVPARGIGALQQAAASVLLGSVERVATAVTRLHDQVRDRVHSSLRSCTVVAATPDLGPTLDLLFHRRGDRLRFGRELAAFGIPATWNYYPLHRTPAYAGTADLPEVDRLWTRVLSVPKLPQPRLTADLVARALLAADRATEEGRRA
jgi:perosamine synthetase